MKKDYKIRVSSKFLEKSGIVAEKKVKVRVPSKFLKRVVKKQLVQKKKIKRKKDDGTGGSPSSSSPLSKLKRFVRSKRGVKVHPHAFSRTVSLAHTSCSEQSKLLFTHKMNRILVTGASGRVGKEVVAGLSKRFGKNATIVAATRDPSVR